MISIALPSLHDQTLTGIDLDWKTGRASIALEVFEHGRVVAVVTEVMHVSMSRERPWGPSTGILSFESDGKRVHVTMQSGDELLITGRLLGFEKAP